jgi:16S rRNA (uracil1498-N3)-methyltransferase
VSLPRFFLDDPPAAPAEGLALPLGAEVARHLRALRLRPGAALELVLDGAVWRADLAALDREQALGRLVAPLREDREPPFALEACLPLTAQLSLWDEWLPPLVELGATRLQPVIYARSEFDAGRTAARMERWLRIVQSACEQSHRTRRPLLAPPVAFEALLTWPTAQRWVAYELPTGQANPPLRPEPLAFTSAPEGGLADGEFEALAAAGWVPVSLGRSILRAVTAPVALLGAVQMDLGRRLP